MTERRPSGAPARERDWPLSSTGRTLVVAATSTAAAVSFVRRHHLASVDLVARRELGALGWLRRVRNADAVVVHTASWKEQRHPQLLQLGLALARGSRRYVADDETGTVRRVGRRELAAALATLPLEVARGLREAHAEARRFRRAERRTPVLSARARLARRSVLAVWLGEPGTDVGGSVTHISGILRGFRDAGLRVGLVTAYALPSQVEALVDDVERAGPLRPGARVSRDIEYLAVNEPVRAAMRRLADRLSPSLVYQRHRAYLVAPAEIAAVLDLPLVLEWNGSEAWARANWQQRRWPETRLAPLLESMERHVASQASIVAAVSEEAAALALDAGADPDRLLIVPNAVDLDAVDAALARAQPGGARTERFRVGWVGTFGPWHGAEVLLAALALLPRNIQAVLVGDGPRRQECERLAREHGLEGRVQFAGALPHAEALAILATCDALASPHVPIPGRKFFGSPTKLFEYMALGRPIVASDLDQLGDVLEHGRTARLVAPGDPKALAEGIRWVRANPRAARELGEAARLEARRSHTWQHRVEAVLRALGDPPPARDAGANRTSPPPRSSVRRGVGLRRRSDLLRRLVRSPVSRQAALFTASTVVSGALALVAKTEVARSVTPASYGAFAFSLSFLWLLALIFEFGLLFPAGRAVAASTPAGRGPIVAGALFLYLPVGVAFGGAVVALSYGIDAWFGLTIGHALRAVAPLTLAFQFGQLALWLAEGAGRLHVYSVAVAAGQACATGAIVALAATGRITVTTALGAQAAGMIAGWAMLVAMLRPRVSGALRWARTLASHARTYGFGVYAGRVLSIGTYNLDVVLIAALTDAQSVARYALAATLARAVGLPGQGIAHAVFARLASGSGRLRLQWLMVAWTLGLGGSALLTMAAVPLAGALFSSRYGIGVALIGPLATAEAVRAVTTLYNTALSARARGRELRNTGIVLAGANVVLTVALVPPFGAVGAAWASLAALVVNLCAHIVYYRRLHIRSPLETALEAAA